MTCTGPDERGVYIILRLKLTASLGVKAGEAKTTGRVLYKSHFLLKLVPSVAYFHQLSPTYTRASPSSLANPGLCHKLVFKVTDGETFVCRAFLDASTWKNKNMP